MREALQGSKRLDSFRVWVPGCSTGEEVYSLAIALVELAQELNLTPQGQVYRGFTLGGLGGGDGRLGQDIMKHVKIIVEKHADAYVAYPLGLKVVVVGEGISYEGALADVKSAIQFHIKTFGAEVLPDDSPLEAFVAEATLEAPIALRCRTTRPSRVPL